MLKKELKRSVKYNEDGAIPELIGKDLEKNIDNVDKKLESDEVVQMLEELSSDYPEAVSAFAERITAAIEGQENAKELLLDIRDAIEGKIPGSLFNRIDDVLDADAVNEDEELEDEEPAEEGGEDEVQSSLDTDLEEPEEEFKDINEKVVVYLYRGFSELGDNVRVFVEDEENEERDPELVETLQDFMSGYPDVMAVIKDLADKYVTSVELFDPEEGEEVNPDAGEEPELELEDDVEDAEVVESYIKEHNLDHSIFESEYEIYAGYKSAEEADKFEEELGKFKGASVFRHEDIGEIHAFVRAK